jgi:LysM repeat protein
MRNYQSFNDSRVARLPAKTFILIDHSYIFKHIIWGFCTFLLIFFCLERSKAQEEQKTYAISLVKTAEMSKEVYEVDNRKVLAQTYIVKKGDCLWKILREKTLWTQGSLPEVLPVIKKLNISLRNLDLIHPGEKIIIPLEITALPRDLVQEASSLKKMALLRGLTDLKFENYTVMPGDCLTKVVKARYNIPAEHLYNKYLNLVKEFNPSIKDVNTIYPGQIIRLPLYSAEIDRGPIEPAISQRPEDKGEDKSGNQRLNTVAHDLCKIFLEIGEECVQSGEHFIPLKSGAQIKLKAASFPVVNLQNGQTVVVDLRDGLPEKMARLIESCWRNYRVVRLVERDDLRSAMDKILGACNYPKVFKRGEPLELQGDIAFRITGDWIISLSEIRSDKRPHVAVINLTDTPTPGTPWIIKDYLGGLGVKIIDYGHVDEDSSEGTREIEILERGTDPFSLIETVFNLIGQPFSSQVEIPVHHQSHRADFQLIVKANFFLKIKGRDAIVDLKGLEPEVISFLGEHQCLYLSLAAEKHPLGMVAKTLRFLDIQFDPGPHSFMATTRNDWRNIKLTLAGIIFPDSRGKPVLATSVNLPGEIAAFLSQKGYKIWLCPSSLSQRSRPVDKEDD